MTNTKKASDSQLRTSYRRHHSIRKVAVEFGMCPQTVHERLQKLGITMQGGGRPWTKADDDVILSEYAAHRNAGRVRELAKRIGRAYTALATRASALGLGNSRAPKIFNLKIKNEAQARLLFEEFKSTSELLWQFCKRKNLNEDLLRTHIRDRWPDEWDAVVEGKAPLQSLYRLGRSFEYRVRDCFKDAGYFVLRSPRSGSPTDLVAIKKGCVVFIQCKRSGVIVSREWNILFNLARSCGAVPVLACMEAVRGMELWEMIGVKDGQKKPQPRKTFIP